ncbi:Retrovirus-related Pol polyprotein from transposon TNT 1-94 [Ceratocystis lukuohia]|uniref:Gag-Pol-p199 n=1 Tax=Ceratocystis lukuohia TaxID=2019550 RepID=A0ABR4MEZ8_9PEZI
MANKTLAPGISVHPATLATSRTWLQNKEESVDPTAVRNWILDLELPTIDEVPYSKWCKKFQDAIIITKTSALFDEAKLEDQTTQILVSRNTWRKELSRCAPLRSAAEDAPFPDILRSIHKRCKDSEVATTAVAYLEVNSQRLTSLNDLGKFISYLRPRVPLCEIKIPSFSDSLAIFVYSQLVEFDRAVAEKVLECGTSDEIFTELTELESKLVSSESKQKCGYCGKNGHVEKVCRQKKRAGKKDSEKTKGNDKPTPKVNSLRYTGEILIDSGADTSVLPNREQFSTYFPSTSFAEALGGTNVKCLGQGTFEFPDDQGALIKIENVIHVPGAQPLVSEGQLERLGYRWNVHPDDTNFLDNRRGSTLSTLWRGLRKWYNVLPKVSALKATTDWHHVFAHINNHYVQRTLAQHGLKAVLDSEKCQSCIKAKITHSPTSSTGLRRSNQALEYLHLDLVGGQNSLPPATSSTDFPLANQFLLVVDEHSLYRWAFPVHSKKDVSILIETLLDQLKNQMGRYPKTLHSDDASEFKSSQCLLLAERRGITWSRSAGYAHEQNGIVERSVRTVCESLCATHESASLPSRLWPETLQGILYILNRTANSVAKTSPYQVLYGKLPDISHLHPIGCRAFWPIEVKKRDKIQPKATSGILLGFHSSNSYYVLEDGPNKRVISRRDVTFIDSEFPLKSQVMALKSRMEFPVAQALSGPEKDKWLEAMHKEVQTLESFDSWEVVPAHSAPRRPMNSKWVLQKKEDGSFKARWCACGYDEEIHTDISAEVLNGVSLRMMLALAASRDLVCHHIDVKSAFLNAELDNPEYIKPPAHMGFPKDHVLKLKKAVYGLRSAPKRWQETLNKRLVDIGFTPLKNDKTIFFNGTTWIAVYVDDMLVMSKEVSDTLDAISSLSNTLQLRDLGPVSSFLGIKVEHLPTALGISQKPKIEKLVEKMNLSQCRGASLPISDDNLIDQESEPLSESEHERYRSIVGSLLHISLFSRPDISYTVMRLSSRTHNPTTSCLQALKHCLRYLHRSKDYSLVFRKNPDHDIQASTDSSWGNNVSPHAISGNVFTINGSAIMWRARKQTLTAQSTCEAEYVAAAGLATTATWLKPLFEEVFQIEEEAPIDTQMDNQSALAVANGSKVSTRNRHFLIKQTSLREAIQAGVIKVTYTPTDQMIADGLTKALPKAKFEEFLCRLGMRKGECSDA